MLLLNRAALIVRAKKPFADWAHSLNDGGHPYDLSNPRLAFSVYLVPCPEGTYDQAAVLEEHWEAVFACQLNGWVNAPDLWPEPRTYRMFRDWFDVELIERVLDATDEELEGFEIDV